MVKRIGFGFFASFFSSLNCRFNRAGYIMRKRHMPMGMDIPANCKPLIAWLSSGRTWERKSPASMHKKTQTTRYFSKKLRVFFFGAMGVSQSLVICFVFVLQRMLRRLVMAAFAVWDSVWAF
jgi:hypothetical protein